MQLLFVENAYFLQSLGWAVVCSCWQVAGLWLLYKLLTTHTRNASPVFKHNLSMVLLTASFCWFIFTLIETYLNVKNGSTFPGSFSTVFFSLITSNYNFVFPYLAIAYSAFFIVHFGHFIRNYIIATLFKKNKLSKAPVELRVFTESTALHFGIHKKVSVWMSEKIDVPAVIGFIKPVILLPAAIVNHLSIQQIEAVLLHEIAHIKRNDFLINLVQSVIMLVLFFNPFAVMLSNAAKKERENCCDDKVLHFNYNEFEYANALYILETQRRLSHGLVLTATNNKKNLLVRIKRLFTAKAYIDYNWFHTFQLALVSAMVILMMTMLVPAVKQQTGTKASIIQIAGSTLQLKNHSIETPAPVFTANTTVVSANTLKKSLPVLRPLKQLPLKDNKEENSTSYTIALVNDELLHSNTNNNAMTISATATPPLDHVFVKIEEQVSGQEQKNTYYLQVDNNNGTPVVKPLVILNESTEMNSTQPENTDSVKKKNNNKITL